MKARIVAIGDEILMGQTLDTNSHYLAKKLTELGFDVEMITAIHDDANSIKSRLNDIIGKVDLALFTGGLGPTSDDITKKTLAEFFGMPLIINKEVLQDVKKFLYDRNLELNELNRKQALVPKGARIIRNDIGTAPAMWFEKNNTVIISMPGVPFEMKYLFENKITDLIKQRFDLPLILIRFIHTLGLIEADLAQKLANFEANLPNNIKIAYLPSPEDIKIRLTAVGKDKKYLSSQLDKLVSEIKQRIGEYIFGYDDENISSAIKKLLTGNGKTIAVAESCTGGNIAHLITSTPGSSEYFKGGIVAYSNEIKHKILGVNKETLEKYGAVSRECVIEMAQGVRRLLNTDYAVATSGIAGPTGGSKDKPVGTVWVAVASENQTIAHKFLFGTMREINIRRSSAFALFELYKLIHNELTKNK